MEINTYLLGYLLNVTLYVFCKSTCPLNALNRRNFDSCASTRSRKRRNLSPSAAAAAPRASCAFRNRNLCSLAANNYFGGKKVIVKLIQVHLWFCHSKHLNFRIIIFRYYLNSITWCCVSICCCCLNAIAFNSAAVGLPGTCNKNKWIELKNKILVIYCSLYSYFLIIILLAVCSHTQIDKGNNRASFRRNK